MSFHRLLDILAARKDPHGLSGDVLVNGAPQPANFKCNSGYVVQVSICGFAFYSSVSMWASASADSSVSFQLTTRHTLRTSFLYTSFSQSPMRFRVVLNEKAERIWNRTLVRAMISILVISFPKDSTILFFCPPFASLLPLA